MNARTTLDALNAMPAKAFVAALGGIFEHSPWVAEAVLDGRPYASVDALCAAMNAAVREADDTAKRALICAHPDLAGKAVIRGELTRASANEQRAAGLDACSPEEYAELHALNKAYHDRHGFPFILAVKGYTRTSILAELRRRLPLPSEAEFLESLRQIERIAAVRLDALLSSSGREPAQDR